MVSVDDGSTSSSILASGADGGAEAAAVGGDGTGCSSFILLLGDSMRCLSKRSCEFPKMKVLNWTGNFRPHI